MALVAGRIIILIIFLLIIPVGTIFLQIYLSKKESVWFGLILPIITFLFSAMAIMGMVNYTTFTHTSYIDITYEMLREPATEGGGQFIPEATNSEAFALIPGATFGIIYTFILMNIPTAVLLIICKAVRSKQNRRRDIEKMSVQDL